MRIVAFPHNGIAYNDSLYAAMEAKGVAVLTGEWSGQWLVKNLRNGDVVHIHWPSFMYLSSGGNTKILMSLVRFILLLMLMRFRRAKICWFAHNLMPHNPCPISWIDIAARHVTIKLSSAVFVHGIEAEKVLLNCFPKCEGKTVRIPHGHWIGRYSSTVSPEKAREELGLPNNAFVYLMFGQCKPYKNIVGLIKAFQSQASSDDYLLIVGSFSDKSYFSEVSMLAQGDARIRITPQFIPDAMVATYFNACDVFCVPYLEILTSGSAMLALSFGKPVLSIDRGFLRDVINNDTGVLVETKSDAELAAAMLTVRNKEWNADLIIRHAQCFTFDDAAKICLDYRNAVGLRY